MTFFDQHKQLAKRVIPISEPLCRPAKWCELQHKCLRYQQAPLQGQALGDFRAGVYQLQGATHCTRFVAVGSDPAPAPGAGPRTFKHWGDA